MTKIKRRRWVCPECGIGKLAPGRLSPTSVLRFCLPCSETTGFLVERSCPSRDREKAERFQRFKDSSIKKKTREEAAEAARSALPGGEDARVVAKKMWKLPALVEYRERAHKSAWRLPDMRFRRRRSRELGSGLPGVTWTPSRSSGHAYPRSNRLLVTFGGHDPTARRTLLHELLHCCAAPEDHHNDRFCAFERQARKEARGRGLLGS